MEPHQADGTLGGFEPDLAQVLCTRMKVQCKLIAQDWDGMITGLNAGKFDVIMDALSITDERKQAIAFSVPYASTPASFAALRPARWRACPGPAPRLTLTGDPRTTRRWAALRTALKGRDRIIQSFDRLHQFIYDNFKDVATISEYKTAAEHDLDLVAGRIDVAFDDSTYFTSAFAKPDNSDLGFAGPQIVGSIWGEGEGAGLRKSDPELKTMFDGAIKAAVADGTVKTLSMKWFKLDVAP